MRAANGDVSGVRVLHKTLDIIETIKDSPAGVKLSDLARTVAMPKATVYRILSTLEGRGFLDRGEDSGYRIARKLFDLQQACPIEQVLNRVAQPFMEQLARSCRETVNLGILDAGEVAVINTVESPQSVRMSSKIGNRRHLHTTAIGKVLLAALPHKDVLRLIRMKGLPRLTPHTLVTKTAVLAELERVRGQGFAIDNQENEIEGRCVGAPIVGPDGRVVAALSISGPEFRMDLARAKSLTPKLKILCTAISKAARG